MKNKFKQAGIALMTAAMAATAHTSHAEGNVANDATETKTNAAARITIGSIIKSENIEGNTPDISITQYYIDQDGDGLADVVRQSINRKGDIYSLQTMYSPFSIVKVIEVFDEKHNMWNITNTEKIGSRKPNIASIQKTR